MAQAPKNACNFLHQHGRRGAPRGSRGGQIQNRVGRPQSHTDVDNPNEFASLQSFETILSLSKYIGANLDIGHMTAANLDAVAFMQKNYARITNLHLKDREKNNGPNMSWGQGETPIKEVPQLMRKEEFPFPANIEFEYPIPAGSSSPAEIAKCLAFAKQCLES